ncbi:NADPH-dependent F420 reductase [Cesiribacter sp. SM1]|uniref:NADPH-dependent F420 reductase n=1 Tax=Cesiribacter sp. SM1 TaxID=2861196 RepID=UPI001CD3ED69|nr:NAD(P)-binding domain-containing protein [Cesiribacter sp. SM1]
MKIGTIGAGRIAKAFTKHAANAGYNVIMSNKSGTDALDATVKTFGSKVKAGTVDEASEADIILLSIPWTEVSEVLHKKKSWNGKIILDSTNAISFPSFKPLDLGEKTSSEIVAAAAQGARVVKAFNTIEAATLASDPNEGKGKRVVVISGDDAAAKAEVLQLLDKMGFAGIDLGSLASGGKLQGFGGPFTGNNIIKILK